jgi:amylosucrase
VRNQHQIFGQAATQILDTHNNHLFAYKRTLESMQTLLVICNFSEHQQAFPTHLQAHEANADYVDLVSRETSSNTSTTMPELAPYQYRWLLTSDT